MSSESKRITLDDDSSDEEVLVTPQAPPRPVKRKLEEEEEFEEVETPEPKHKSILQFFIIYALVGGLLGVGAYWASTHLLAIQKDGEQTFPLFSGTFKDTRSEHALYNTTTTDIVWRVRKSLQGQVSRHPCLCMHHLVLNASIPFQVRICNVYNAEAGQHYFMMNPRIIGALRPDLQVPKLEMSISCKEPRDRHVRRHTAVFVEWEDEQARTHYALFRDNQAFCLQLSLDEFQGEAGPQCK